MAHHFGAALACLLSKRHLLLLFVFCFIVAGYCLTGSVGVPSALAASPSVVVVGSVVKVRPFQQITGNADAHLVAARNEFQSFQVVIQAGSTPLSGVTVSLATPLTGNGRTISPNNVIIYREDYYNVQEASDQEGATGPWPDALIPVTDTLLGQHRNAFPINVPAGENRVAWIDVLVPQTATAGIYNGTLAVTAGTFNTTVSVQLTVPDLMMPSTASLTSAYRLEWDEACMAHFQHTCINTPAIGWKLNTLYVRAALNNRITISQPNYQPPIGAANISLFHQYTLPLLNGTDPGLLLPGARLTSIEVDKDPTSLSAWKTEATNNAFADRAFVYACDEPDSKPASWVQCKAVVQDAHSAWNGIPILITTSIQDANQAATTSDINRMVVPIRQMEDKVTGSPTYVGDQSSTYNSFLQNGANQVWLYTSCDSHGCEPHGVANPAACVSSRPGTTATNDVYYDGWAGYVIDEPASEARAMGWLAYLYGSSGELYYDTNLCLETATTAQYAYGGNGDGTLFYAGTPSWIGGTDDIPIESIRLKLIRDGYEDYEYMKLATARGKGPQARAIAQSLFANTYSTDRSDADIQMSRQQLLDLLSTSTPTPSTMTPTVAPTTPSVAPTPTVTQSAVPIITATTMEATATSTPTNTTAHATATATPTPTSPLPSGGHTQTDFYLILGALVLVAILTGSVLRWRSRARRPQDAG